MPPQGKTIGHPQPLLRSESRGDRWVGAGWSASEFVKPRAWRQLGPPALLGSTTRRLTRPCWHWDLPLSDRPLLHDCMPHRAHCERQVSHVERERTQSPPSSLGKGKSRPPLAGPARQLWPATLAGPAHEAYVGGRRLGESTCPARPTHDNGGANFMPLCRSGPRYQRARGNAGLWSTCGCEVLPSTCRLKTSRLDVHFVNSVPVHFSLANM